jgi:hypothetical protein
MAGDAVVSSNRTCSIAVSSNRACSGKLPYDVRTVAAIGASCEVVLMFLFLIVIVTAEITKDSGVVLVPARQRYQVTVVRC